MISLGARTSVKVLESSGIKDENRVEIIKKVFNEQTEVWENQWTVFRFAFRSIEWDNFLRIFTALNDEIYRVSLAGSGEGDAYSSNVKNRIFDLSDKSRVLIGAHLCPLTGSARTYVAFQNVAASMGERRGVSLTTEEFETLVTKLPFVQEEVRSLTHVEFEFEGSDAREAEVLGERVKNYVVEFVKFSFPGTRSKLTLTHRGNFVGDAVLRQEIASAMGPLVVGEDLNFV